MKKNINLFIFTALMVFSMPTFAKERSNFKEYEHNLEKMYPTIQAEGKTYELEYDIKDLGDFILLEVEIEDNFFSNKDVNFGKDFEAIVDIVALKIKADYNKPVRAVAEYEDTNILHKKYY